MNPVTELLRSKSLKADIKSYCNFTMVWINQQFHPDRINLENIFTAMLLAETVALFFLTHMLSTLKKMMKFVPIDGRKKSAAEFFA